MNQNDMDRYYWRTGQRWDGDDRRIRRLRGREIFFLFVAFLVTLVALVLMR